MNKKRLFQKVMKIVFMISVNIFILLSIVEFASFDMEFYRDSFRRNSTQDITGYTEEELMLISQEIVSYLGGGRDDFNISMGGELVFGERESLHMVDVRDLFEKGFAIRWISLSIAIATGLYLLLRDSSNFGKLVRQSSLGGIIVVLLFGAIVYLNFKDAFDVFHEILFTNDLWLLNPRTDTLIQMLPLDFFYRLALRMARMYGFVMGSLFALGALLSILSPKSKKYE